MNNIELLRIQHDMTQTEFAEYCGLSRSSIARYESGQEISRENAMRIAAACNVSVDFVLGISNGVTIVSSSNIPTNLTDEELLLIAAYRESSLERKAIVMDILGRKQ